MELTNQGGQDPHPSSPVKLYMQHLDNIFQQEPSFFRNDSTIPGIPGVSAIVYQDVPEPGYITAFTYGLSLVDHPNWKHGRPELTLTVRSDQREWGTALAYIANELRGQCAFSYGETIRFGGPIAADSQMDAFLVFAPSILEREDYIAINTGESLPLTIAALYPIYSQEIPVYQAMGLQAFWHHPGFDLYDVQRPLIE